MGKLLNSLFKITICLFVIAACKSSKDLPQGAPPTIKLKTLLEKAQAAENSFQKLRVKTSAKYEQGNTSQNFRLEIRILKDSLIWLDIADPILGLKVARAVVYQDSVAFVQHLPDKQFYTGKLEDLQNEFRLDFGFETLQAILSANLIFDLSNNFALYYEVGSYLLSDFDPKREGNFGRSEFRQIRLEPAYLKPLQQTSLEKTTGRNYVVNYQDIEQKEQLLFPESVEISLSDEGEETRLFLDVKSLGKDDDRLSFPFNIPSGYAKMDL